MAYDWWTQASRYWPNGTVATVIDVQTGVSFKVQRTMGTNHAIYGNYRMAAGMISTPEGSEKITNNGVTGHMNIHFLNSRTHGSNRVTLITKRRLRPQPEIKY